MQDTNTLDTLRRVAVGSRNPVKVAAVRAVLARIVTDVEVDGVAVESKVPDQPWGDEETIRGARTRATLARERLDADLGVGIEGGVVDTGDGVRTCAWAVVVSRDGRSGVGGSLAMPLPDSAARLLKAGVELGHAMDRLASTTNVKQGVGAVGILTAGLIDRQRAYEALVTYALAPFLAESFWRPVTEVTPASEGEHGRRAGV